MTVQLAGADGFARWASVADAVRSTTKRLQKLAALVDYLPSLPDDSLAIAARFFSGVVFPRHDARTTGPVRVANPPVEGRVMRGEEGMDVGDEVRVKLLHTDPQRGFIDFAG